MTVLIRALVVLGCMLLPYTSWAASSAFEWTRQTDSGVRNWTQLDSSYDGTKLVAGVYSGYIYISDDGGETWTAKTNSGMRSWVSVTSSANGTKLAAVDQSPGYIYTSDDRGETWTEHTGPGSRQWQDIESSEDGSVIVAVAWGAGVYVSEDGGDTWDEKEVLGTKDWDAAAISADGTKLFVAPNFGGLYVSEDGGDTWDEDTVLGDQYWYGLSVSEDASVIVAGGAGSLLRVSNDSGATWQIVGAEELGYGYWSDPGISNDGTIIVLVDDGRAVDGEIGRVITSNDSGATWAENDLPAVSWSGATVSGDGTRAVVSPWGSDDHIYTADTVFAAASSGGDYARSLPRAPRVLVTDVNRSSATISVFVNERNGITGAGLTVSGEECY